MLHSQLDFVIPENQSISELVSLLQNNFPVRVLAEIVNNRVFYDTFDWRLYKNGSVLEKHEDGQPGKIYWRAGKHGKLKIQLGLRKVPRLASDLADCEFRQQLQSVISVRELTPRIKIKVKRLPLVVLDKNEKVVVRLNFDEYWCSPSRLRAGQVLGKRLSIKAVKGYLKDYQQVEDLFLAMKLHPARDNMMKLALHVKGVSAGEYTTKLNLLLDPDMSAEQALKKILLRLLEIMRQNTTGSISGRDTEFMHDYRVSIRKTRTALKQINDVLPQAVSTKYKKFFSMLGKLTTPVRDLDVFLLQLESYQRDFSKSEQQQLQALGEYLLLSRAEAQKKYIEVLKSSQYRENIKQWSDYLEHSGTESFPPDKPSKAVYKLADELLWEIYQQAIEQGNAITNNSKAETLHELRKTFKKLRYLMEFFRSIYPAGKMSVLIHALKALQDNLGKFNDLDVHIGIVKEFIKQSMNEDAIKACEQMITILEQQQRKTRTKFVDCYAAFSSSDNQSNFKQMFVDYLRER
ncbi:MAG: CHAD domain-containing protein [Gammaproteobacteria bacterium]|nr:CHAD domain-containing protein [Gammaproteobacteria bacterium]